MTDSQTTRQKLDPYEGNDMTSFMMKHGFQLADEMENVKSITNVRDTAIIVTDLSIYRSEPYHDIGFAIRRMVSL